VNNDLRELILAKVPVQISSPLNKMLSFSTSSVGASMNPLVPTLPEDISIKDAKKRIKKHKQQLFHYIFITRRNNRFAGIVKLEDLINGDSGVQLGSIMNTDVPHLPASTDFLKILNHPGWIEYTALPVVDRLDNFLGAISHGDVRRIENAVKFKVPSQTTLTSNALGELYKIGLESLLYSASERTIKEKQK
jgi:Mg/Co/Ni transporter MgtE